MESDEVFGVIVAHIESAFADDPDWVFFHARKNKTLKDAELIRTYSFAASFVAKWQDKSIYLLVI
jgi:hypothetical protein